MSTKSFLITGLLAILLIGVPFWYLYTFIYPQYASNWLYLGIGGLAFVVFAAVAARFVVKRRR